MTTNYLSQTKQRSWTRQLLGWSVIFVSVFLFLHVISSVLFDSWSTTQRSTAAISKLTSLLFTDKRALVSENQSLREALQQRDLAVTLAVANREAYMDLYRATTGVGDTDIVVEVLQRPPHTPYDQYILGSGTGQGISAGQLVISARQEVVGYIDHTTPQASQAVLFSSPDQRFDVSIDGGIYPAQGNGGGVILVRLPRNFAQTSGQIVRIPGATPYVLGALEATEFNPQDSYVVGVLTMQTNIYTQSLLTVVDSFWQPSIQSNNE